MTISAFAAARHLCLLSKWTATDAAVHRILYVAHAYHMGRSSGGLLVAERFSTSDRGPVVPALVDVTRKFGTRPIRDEFGAQERLLKAETDILGEMWARFGANPESAALAHVVRHPKSAFARKHVRGRAIPIPDREIFEEYMDIYMGTDEKVDGPSEKAA